MSTVAPVDLDAEIVAELTGLADLLEPASPTGWDTPSLCEGWRVREAVAHVTLAAHRTAPQVLLGLVRSRFRWQVAADRLARQDARRPTDELLAALRSSRLHAWRPPGGGATGALVHAVVHGLDVTLPLGLDRPLPPARARAVLDGLTAAASLEHFGVDVDGLALRADDVGWTHGTGHAVHADAQSLVLALTARRALPG